MTEGRIAALERGMAALTERIEQLEDKALSPRRIGNMPAFLRAATKRVAERAS